MGKEMKTLNGYEVVDAKAREDIGEAMELATGANTAAAEAYDMAETAMSDAEAALAKQETDPTVPAWAKQTSKPSYTASEVGADTSGTAESKVSAHNTSDAAHNDIRLLIYGLTTRLNALANSTDEDLDQLSEIVAYIKSNKSLIDSITTSKVNVADIVNNLATNVTNKPLSAAQGVALKALIDAITVPTKTSQITNDSGFLTQHQDISGKADKSSAETWTFTLEDGSTVTKKVVLA